MCQNIFIIHVGLSHAVCVCVSVRVVIKQLDRLVIRPPSPLAHGI